MKAVIPIFLIAIAAGVAAFLVVDPLHDRAAAYKSENEAILDQLPPPPVAREVTSAQEPYEQEGISSIINRSEGWVLTIVYGVPEGMSADDVIAWYQDQLPPGWSSHVDELPNGADPQTGQPRPPIRHLVMVSGEKQAAIDLTNMQEGANQTFELAIDHKGGRSP